MRRGYRRFNQMSARFRKYCGCMACALNGIPYKSRICGLHGLHLLLDIIFITGDTTKSRPGCHSGRVDRASASEAVDLGSIPGRVKPKTIKIGIHSFPA